VTRAIVAFAFASCVGCAGARTTVVAPTANVPVSLSHAVRDADGTIVSASRREVVGAFHDERLAWGVLWSAIKLTPTKDISDEINAQVARAGGDAVINLRIASGGCGWNYVIGFNLLPVWPGCNKLFLDGDIVRVKEEAR
jgi:hypothetical protein